jgi:hypothetical protein
VITGRTYETKSKDVLKELNWQPLSERLNRNKRIFMHKIKNNVTTIIVYLHSKKLQIHSVIDKKITNESEGHL